MCPNCNASFSDAPIRPSVFVRAPNTFEDFRFHGTSVSPNAATNPFQPPTYLDETISENTLISLILLFFSFKGRVPRLTYWCVSIAIVLAYVCHHDLVDGLGRRV